MPAMCNVYIIISSLIVQHRILIYGFTLKIPKFKETTMFLHICYHLIIYQAILDKEIHLKW